MKAEADRYLITNNTLSRLKEELKQHKSLFIAFDFDNTVYDYHQVGDIYPLVESILKKAKQLGHKLILFTGNEGDRLIEIIDYCGSHGYSPDFVNENPIMSTRKPYYNILLDDRAGLNESYSILKEVLNEK